MKERVAIIDFGAGNLRSVEKAFARVVRDEALAVDIAVTSNPAIAAEADRIVLPGVGAFAACMAGLNAIDGMTAAIEHAALVKARPFLGICVGMQILAERGLEFGVTPGLGWISGEVRAFEARPDRRSPHMGWNNVTLTTPHPALSRADGEDFYFLHSYHFVVENPAHCVAVCDYGGAFAVAVARDNILGLQFHPEKSQQAGLAVIADFLRWRP